MKAATSATVEFIRLAAGAAVSGAPETIHPTESRQDLALSESTSAPGEVNAHSSSVFESLFERSTDAIWLYDPHTARLVDCNQAAVSLIGADNKSQILNKLPEQISPPFQPDGISSADKAAGIIATVEREKSCRFEWIIRRLDGVDVPVEVSSTAVMIDGRSIHVLISRDISQRRKA